MRRLLVLLLATLSARSADIPWVAIASDTKGFALQPGAAFVPWGFNYGRDWKFRLLEDYWDAEWSTVEQHFADMKRLGANVVRVHLQYGKFMDAPDRVNQANLACLEKLLRLAESTGVYLDLTGLGTFRVQDNPPWYSAMNERDRWAAQARFWEEVARVCADRPGVFAYNLMNEPVVTAEKRRAGEWVHPSEISGLHYVEYINLDAARRDRTEIARQWIRQMTQAIRKYDRRHLVTVGLILIGGQKPEEAAGFPPAKIAPEVDFLAVHIYPEKGKVDAAIDTVRKYRVGKPVLIEETFPLRCSVPEFAEFMRRSREVAAGWIGHYWGQTPEQLKSSTEVKDVRTLRWLELFQTMDPNRGH